MIQRAADDLGISFAQFVREAALMRSILIVGSGSDLERISSEIIRLARRDD